jgi:hypothetical protein
MDGAAELALRSPTLSRLLISLEWLHHVRLFFVVLLLATPRLLATGNGRWPSAATAPPRSRAPGWHGCGHARSCWVGTALGRSPSRAGSPSFPARVLGPKAVADRLASLGRPVSDKKNWFFVFHLLFGKINALEIGCVIILASKIVKQIL